MEFNKKKVTDFLSNNAIVILLVLLVLFVGFTRKGFFSGPNYSNIITNVTPRFIIALGVSGCLITKGTDLSAAGWLDLEELLPVRCCSGRIIPQNSLKICRRCR
ncbi:MAG: hypothetical protein ACLSA6_06325 [Holdemania massiliensis]